MEETRLRHVGKPEKDSVHYPHTRAFMSSTRLTEFLMHGFKSLENQEQLFEVCVNTTITETKPEFSLRTSPGLKLATIRFITLSLVREVLGAAHPKQKTRGNSEPGEAFNTG